MRNHSTRTTTANPLRRMAVGKVRTVPPHHHRLPRSLHRVLPASLLRSIRQVCLHHLGRRHANAVRPVLLRLLELQLLPIRPFLLRNRNRHLPAVISLIYNLNFTSFSAGHSSIKIKGLLVGGMPLHLLPGVVLPAGQLLAHPALPHLPARNVRNVRAQGAWTGESEVLVGAAEDRRGLRDCQLDVQTQRGGLDPKGGDSGSDEGG
jgi:hypothetical protein